MTDNVNQPAHYTAGGIETIDVIESVFSKYDHRDQVEKYNQRAHLKGNFKQDLEKARWYLNRTIENCEGGKLDPVTGAPVGTGEEQDTSGFANDLDTNTLYQDDDGDFWAYNYQDEKWYFYRMVDGKVEHKAGRGFSQSGMSVFTRDFFSQVPDKLPILQAIQRYEADEAEPGAKFDTATVHKDAAGDYWVFNESTQEWNWYTLSEELSTVEKHGGSYTVEGIERYFDTSFVKPVVLMRTERLVREAVEKFDNPAVNIVLGETDPEDMPVGTVAYRDGQLLSYNVRKEANGWVLSHYDFAFHGHDSLVASWFKNEEGWTLEKPSDVYIDTDGDYWANTGDGWRWHHIENGDLLYTSVRSHEFEDIKESFSLTKLSDADALRVRRIIKKGEK